MISNSVLALFELQIKKEQNHKNVFTKLFPQADKPKCRAHKLFPVMLEFDSRLLAVGENFLFILTFPHIQSEELYIFGKILIDIFCEVAFYVNNECTMCGSARCSSQWHNNKTVAKTAYAGGWIGCTKAQDASKNKKSWYIFIIFCYAFNIFKNKANTSRETLLYSWISFRISISYERGFASFIFVEKGTLYVNGSFLSVCLF